MDRQTPKFHIFRCVTGLRGFHVYQVDWKPILGQEIVFSKIFIHLNFMYLKMFSSNSR